ncbi:hypothetical protein EYC84_002260 [Monilinia fructicola]|uniref:THO complex subunit 2 N-terminal domain-containing protein n=1 Tax=Monilinia fructicola TaxID=38448 RepID=A0A5M9JMN1_MONFR|nr:hypothetical protein EYC84_002260 [Monilinia fructicola]
MAPAGKRKRNDRNSVDQATRATPTPGPMSPPPRPSSAAQTPAQTPTPNDMISPSWNPEPAPFDYVFLTDDQMSSWNATGRQQVVEKGHPSSPGRRYDGLGYGPDTAPAEDVPGTLEPQTLFLDSLSMIGSEPPSSEVVEDAFEKVKGLIGTFDLDVGRVLDITLDVFAAVLIKHFRFFIKLLRASSWWPRSGDFDQVTRCGGLPPWALPSAPGWTSTDEEEEIAKIQRLERDKLFWDRAREVGIEAFFELGGRQAVDAETKERFLKEDDAKLDADHLWIKATGTYPPSGNRTAAQLLGFKLRFYASAARDNEDITTCEFDISDGVVD